MGSEACLWCVPSAWPGSHLPWKGRPRSGSWVSAFLALTGTWLSRGSGAPGVLPLMPIQAAEAHSFPVCPWQAHKSFLCGNC